MWTDLCNSILPTTEEKATEQALARKGKKGWQSDGSELASYNLRGRKEVLKQKQWNTRRVWWAPVLAKGKLHVVIFDEGFPGEVPDGAAILVAKLRAAVNARWPGRTRKPTCVFVDRGKGFYNPGNGKITPEFSAALTEHGFTAFWGQDASAQPGHLQELMLHETAVSWLRHRLTETLPKLSWKETPDQFAARLRLCCTSVNKELEVEDLCRDFPRRVALLQERNGGRLSQ